METWKTALQCGLESQHLHLLLGMVCTGRAQPHCHSQGMGLGTPRARGTALMCLEGQTLMALHGVEPDYPSGPLDGSL